MSVPQSSPSYPQLSTKLTHLSLLIGILHSDINPEFTVTGCESHWALHINSNKCICWVLYRAICRPSSFQCHLQPCKSFNLSRDQIRQEPERAQTAEGALTVLSSSILSEFNNANKSKKDSGGHLEKWRYHCTHAALVGQMLLNY